MIAKAMEIWPPDLIEDALGSDAAAVLPDAVRLTDLHVRVRRYHAVMLEYLAERDRTTISGRLTLELDAIASPHAQELDGVIPGFTDALLWPARKSRARTPALHSPRHRPVERIV